MPLIHISAYNPNGFSLGPSNRVLMDFNNSGTPTTFINNGNANTTITLTGTPKITTTMLRSGTPTLDVNTGSVRLDSSPNLMIGTQDFTIEFWVRTSALPDGRAAGATVLYLSAGVSITLGDSFYGSSVRMIDPGVGAPWVAGRIGYYNGPMPLNTWAHLSLSRSNNELYTHYNGVLAQTVGVAASYSLGNSVSEQSVTLQKDSAANVYLDDVRIMIGQAFRTKANFTPVNL